MSFGDVIDESHAPPPTGYGVYWAINQDWRKPVLFGLFFILLTVAVLTPYFTWLTKAQSRSFAAVSVYLSEYDLRELPTAKACALSHDNGIFHWRGLVWQKIDEHWAPHLFSAKIDASDDYRIIEARLTSYDRDTAYALEVYDQVNFPLGD